MAVSLQYEQLLGRQYVPGKVHCLTLVRDFYRVNYGIEIDDYAVPSDWDADDLNLIEMVYEAEGFEKVYGWDIKKAQPGDLLCVAVGSGHPNHFLIYLGEGQLLHHPLHQLSRVDPWRGFWRNSMCFVLRHKDVTDTSAAKPDVSIQELIDARYAPEAAA